MTTPKHVSGTDIDRAILQSMVTSLRSGMDFSFNRHDMAELLDRLAAIQPDPEPQPVARTPFNFDRYIDGRLMAEGVSIHKQETLEDAMAVAAKLASRGPNGEVPVLVFVPDAPSSAGTVSVEAAAQALLEWWNRTDGAASEARKIVAVCDGLASSDNGFEQFDAALRALAGEGGR